MNQEWVTELLEFCRSELGADLRTVTRYSRDDHNPIYTRAGIPEQIQLDSDTRSVLRYPLVQMQKAMWQLTDAHPTLAGPDSAIVSYGDITVFQFPITRAAGLIVTLDSTGELPAGFEFRCKSIVDGANGGARGGIEAPPATGDTDGDLSTSG